MSGYSKGFLLELYRKLYTIRVFETRCIRLYREGLIRGYLHPYLGEEAIAVGVCAALRREDCIASTHRGHGHCIARGADLERMVAEIAGRRDGYCLGRGGSMHIVDMSLGNLGANGIVGGGIPIAVGAALGASLRDDGRVAAVFASDGAANNGVFGEGLNFAAAFDLPVIFVIENNQYAVSTPVEDSTREPDLYKRGAAYGVESHCVDGNDVLAVYERALVAARVCRSGAGPILIEAKTYRHSGHHVNDPGQYMPREKLELYRSRDPCVLGRRYLLEQGAAGEEEIAALEAGIEEAMERAVTFARSSPEPTVEEFLEDVRSYS